jgi:voltage-gated potassium channel
MKAFLNLRLIAAALLLLVLIGTTGFHFIEGCPWFDGLYMTLTSFTTIGYQEIHPLSHAARIFNLGLIVSGVSLVFLGIGSPTQALLEFELASFFGRREMEREISRLSDHYIICGAGCVGRSAARQLARRPAPFLIIEQSETKAARFSGEWLIRIGDATQEQTLRDAQIERARGLVAATLDLNPRLEIIAVSPYLFAGQRIAQSFLRPHVVGFLDTATTHLGMDLEIGEISLPSYSSFAGKTIERSGIRRDRGVIILAFSVRFNPSPEDRIEPCDYLIAMGEPGQLRQLEQMAVAAFIKIIIKSRCGNGHLARPDRAELGSPT